MPMFSELARRAAKAKSLWEMSSLIKAGPLDRRLVAQMPAGVDEPKLLDRVLEEACASHGADRERELRAAARFEGPAIVREPLSAACCVGLIGASVLAESGRGALGKPPNDGELAQWARICQGGEHAHLAAQLLSEGALAAARRLDWDYSKEGIRAGRLLGMELVSQASQEAVGSRARECLVQIANCMRRLDPALWGSVGSKAARSVDAGLAGLVAEAEGEAILAKLGVVAPDAAPKRAARL